MSVIMRSRRKALRVGAKARVHVVGRWPDGPDDPHFPRASTRVEHSGELDRR